MSIYSGFATRNQESTYNKLLVQLIQVMEQWILKHLLNQDDQPEKILSQMAIMERCKYFPPKFTVYFSDLTTNLSIKLPSNQPVISINANNQLIKKSTEQHAMKQLRKTLKQEHFQTIDIPNLSSNHNDKMTNIIEISPTQNTQFNINQKQFKNTENNNFSSTLNDVHQQLKQSDINLKTNNNYLKMNLHVDNQQKKQQQQQKGLANNNLYLKAYERNSQFFINKMNNGEIYSTSNSPKTDRSKSNSNKRLKKQPVVDSQPTKIYQQCKIVQQSKQRYGSVKERKQKELDLKKQDTQTMDIIKKRKKKKEQITNNLDSYTIYQESFLNDDPDANLRTQFLDQSLSTKSYKHPINANTLQVYQINDQDVSLNKSLENLNNNSVNYKPANNKIYHIKTRRLKKDNLSQSVGKEKQFYEDNLYFNCNQVDASRVDNIKEQNEINKEFSFRKKPSSDQSKNQKITQQQMEIINQIKNSQKIQTSDQYHGIVNMQQQ